MKYWRVLPFLTFTRIGFLFILWLVYSGLVREPGAQTGRSTAIVFIHGIHGSPDGTWKNESNMAYWPDLMKRDQTFSDADVIVEGYPTPYTGNHNDVDDIAHSLEMRLKNVFTSHKRVIFICHSLGGLIVKQMIIDYPNLAQKVPFIVFYATPGSGAFIARFLSVFSGDPLLKSMSDSGDNNYLLELERRWRSAGFTTHRYCAYEEEKMRPKDLRSLFVGGTANAGPKLLDFVGGIYVVDPFSATYGCDDKAPFTGIKANHIQIVKPQNSGDPIYELFATYYRNNGVAPVQVIPQVLRFDKPLCAFYGEANQGQNAWNKDEQCPIENIATLDQGYQQTDFKCCGGSATSSMTAMSVPRGLEVRTDGGYYWSVDKGYLEKDIYHLHTYCGPSGGFEGGCNVKVKVIGHYAISADQRR